jgi:hypothetical protein
MVDTALQQDLFYQLIAPHALLVNIQQTQDKLKILVLIASWVNTKPYKACMVVLFASGGNMQEQKPR